LASKEVGDRIVESLGTLERVHVLEIGAGSGALTYKLADCAERLTALEVDPGLACSLEEAFKKRDDVTISIQDVLEFDFPAWSRSCPPLVPVVVGNIPYRITSSLLHRLIDCHRELGLVVLMLQEEVARRLTAPAGRKPYGMLSVLASYYAEVRYLFSVERKNFRPQPRVDSAVVKLDFAKPYPRRAVDEKLFVSIVRRLFLERRKQVQKMLRKDPRFNLSTVALERLSLDTGLDLTCRPEEIPVDRFVALADSLFRLKGEAKP